MEPYRNYGRNSCGRGNNQNYGCQTNRQPRNNQCAIDRVTSMDKSHCGCGDDNYNLKNLPLAMGYVPIQSWGDLYDPETALCQGTAFPELNLIFCGSRGKM